MEKYYVFAECADGAVLIAPEGKENFDSFDEAVNAAKLHNDGNTPISVIGKSFTKEEIASAIKALTSMGFLGAGVALRSSKNDEPIELCFDYYGGTEMVSMTVVCDGDEYDSAYWLYETKELKENADAIAESISWYDFNRVNVG